MGNHSEDTKTWTGDPAEFDAVYEWAGNQHVMESNDANGDHHLSAFDGSEWRDVPANATLVKTASGIEVTKDGDANLFDDGDGPEPDGTDIGNPTEGEGTETKDEGQTGAPVETKPAKKTASAAK